MNSIMANIPIEDSSTKLDNKRTDVHQETNSFGNRSGSWGGVNESDEDIEKITNDSQSTEAGRQNANCNLSRTSYCENGHNNTLDDPVCISEDKMRRRLRFFFMTPLEKWAAKRRLPWKLLVQILKIIIVTTQVGMFASQRYNHVGYLSDTKISFSHLFIKGWDASREVDVYPPSSGPLALYEIEDFYSSIDYSVLMFTKVENTALGTYKYEKKNGTVVMPKFCYTQYKNCTIDLYNLTYALNKEIIEQCIVIPSSVLENSTNWSIKQYLASLDATISFDLLLEAEFILHLRTIRLTLELPFQSPECYQLSNIIRFNNHDHDGQMVIESDVDAVVLQCEGFVNSVKESDKVNTARITLNILTLIVCILSFIMCSRSLYRAQTLKTIAEKFFISHLNLKLSRAERFEFTNLWYVLICISDVFVVFGSIIKMTLEQKAYEGFLDKWNYCALLLGIGNLLVWFGCLRYLGFFDTYNVLILTIKNCLPNVIRYSVCILMVYAGFALCGWLVLGPYNLKFRSFSATVECLFSLVNGDDMFATFASTAMKDDVVWWFARIYLYSFISLFIYVILSLFIAIIMDSYDTVKKFYEEGFPPSDMRKFAMDCDLDPFSSEHWDDQDTTIHDFVNSLLCCFSRARPLEEYEQMSS